jgi:hypothetical protein
LTTTKLQHDVEVGPASNFWFENEIHDVLESLGGSNGLLPIQNPKTQLSKNNVLVLVMLSMFYSAICLGTTDKPQLTVGCLALRFQQH